MSTQQTPIKPVIQSHEPTPQPPKPKVSLFYPALYLALVVGISFMLLFMVRGQLPQTAQQPTATLVAFDTVSKIVTPTAIKIQATPTLVQNVTAITQPMACRFTQPVAKSNLTSDLDKFTFSEPKVILSREGVAIDLIEALPDNQKLLLYINGGEVANKHIITVLDTSTTQTEVYADNLENARQIHWLPDKQEVAFIDRKTQQFSGIDQEGLWLSQGNPQQLQLIADKAVETINSKSSLANLPARIAEKYALPDFGFDPEQWRYNKYPDDEYFMNSWANTRFQQAISPDNSKVAFYGVPWLYLVDLKTQHPCEVELGQYIRADFISWSPDSRQLAMIVADGYQGDLMKFNKLLILDTLTGEIYEPVLDMKFVWDIAWFPDSRHIIAMGFKNNVENSANNQQLGLVDIQSRKAGPILPKQFFGGGSGAGYQLALSKNGQFLAVNCPLVSEEYKQGVKNQICLITIVR